tara:strand:+ start:660 stop:899 length:240 start_codon:yes stop_codon:yes gene_type:complete
MELILTQSLLLVVTIALIRVCITVRDYKDDFSFINHKLRGIDKELMNVQYYPQPEDFNTFDKEFNAPSTPFHEPHESIK